MLAGRDAGQPLEEAVEIARVTKAEPVADLLHRLHCLLETQSRFLDQPLVDQGQRRPSGRAEARLVEAAPASPRHESGELAAIVSPSR